MTVFGRGVDDVALHGRGQGVKVLALGLELHLAAGALDGDDRVVVAFEIGVALVFGEELDGVLDRPERLAVVVALGLVEGDDADAVDEDVKRGVGDDRAVD